MADQKDLILLLTNQLGIMRTMNFIAIIAVIVGPIAAVVITLWYQRRRQKFDTKNNLFLRLMAQRRANPPSVDLVNSLNLIDVVYSEHPRVVSLWHDYYDLRCQPQVNESTALHKYIDLLSEMAKSLGYKALSQTDIDRFYYPRIHEDLAQLNLNIQQEWLRVLRNTERFLVDKKDDEKPS